MVDARDPSRGVLVDLDIAARVRDGTRRLTPSLPHAGTLGFRAIDLLERNTHHPTEAFYRHDLESFFWVLAYIATLYGDGERLPIRNEFENWWEPSLEDNAAHKEGFLIAHRYVRGKKVNVASPLITEWVRPLQAMLWDAYSHRSHHDAGLRKGTATEWTVEQTESFDGMITFDKFISLLT